MRRVGKQIEGLQRHQRVPAVDQPLGVTITGHSLGGTLSVVMSLWLADTQPSWDPQGRVTLACHASAAQTAGNGDFASYYDASLGRRTRRIYNSLDTIPHYWSEADLDRLPDLYQPDIAPDLVIDAVVTIARAAAAGGGYTQTNRATPPLAISAWTCVGSAASSS